MPPRGTKKGTKRARQYEHIKDSLQERGTSEDEAEEIAARTVNKERARSGEARTSSTLSRDGHLVRPARWVAKPPKGTAREDARPAVRGSEEPEHSGSFEDEQGRAPAGAGRALGAVRPRCSAFPRPCFDSATPGEFPPGDRGSGVSAPPARSAVLIRCAESGGARESSQGVDLALRARAIRRSSSISESGTAADAEFLSVLHRSGNCVRDAGGRLGAGVRRLEDAPALRRHASQLEPSRLRDAGGGPRRVEGADVQRDALERVVPRLESARNGPSQR